MTLDHAYSHLVGRTVGVKVDGVGIVAASVMTPEPDQSHNDLLVMVDGGTWMTIPYMDTYRANFVNASLV